MKALKIWKTICWLIIIFLSLNGNSHPSIKDLCLISSIYTYPTLAGLLSLGWQCKTNHIPDLCAIFYSKIKIKIKITEKTPNTEKLRWHKYRKDSPHSIQKYYSMHMFFPSSSLLWTTFLPALSNNSNTFLPHSIPKS